MSKRTRFQASPLKSHFSRLWFVTMKFSLTLTVLGMIGVGVVAQPKAETGPTKPAIGKFESVVEKYDKLDTPSWDRNSGAVLFADLTRKKLYKVGPGDKTPEIARAGLTRGRVGPDGQLYGLSDAGIETWNLTDDPKPLLLKSALGTAVSLNDLIVSKAGKLYFTTLKDPEKGRVTSVDIKTGTAAVVYEGKDVPDLANPNGIALSPDEKFLYVGVSNYKNKKTSGLYRFPLAKDGSVEVAAGKIQRWAEVEGADGLAVDRDGNLYASLGSTVKVLSPEGKPIAEGRVPSGAITNLCFGGTDGKSLYVTTSTTLWVAPSAIPGAGEWGPAK